jgi:hypothetical protein
MPGTPDPRPPELALLDQGIPRLRVMSGWCRVLSIARHREELGEETLDDTLVLMAGEIDAVLAILLRWQHYEEL